MEKHYVAEDSHADKLESLGEAMYNDEELLSMYEEYEEPSTHLPQKETVVNLHQIPFLAANDGGGGVIKDLENVGKA